MNNLRRFGNMWDNIIGHNTVPVLTTAQKAELDHRLENYMETPNDVLTWDEVKAAAMHRLSVGGADK